jgi:predicted RecA/RadA family phage recombinase
LKNYIQPGNVIPFTAGSAITSGDVVEVGTLIGIATNDVANGEQGELALTGVFEVAKATADTPSAGAKAYWDGTEATTTATANTLMGVFVHAYGAGILLAHVRLDGTAV